LRDKKAALETFERDLALLGGYRFIRRVEHQLTFMPRVNFNHIAVADVATWHAAGERVLNQSLTRAPTRAELRIGSLRTLVNPNRVAL